MCLIVSLTSISSRISVLRHTLLSILGQSFKPDRIVVCLSKNPYLVDEGINMVPRWLEEMVENNQVEISWVENIGPYRKLIPVYRQAAEGDWIVTCDDDVIYDTEWLSSLVQSGKEHPDAIVCGRARSPAINFWKCRQSYSHWPLALGGSKGKNLVPTGIAGVLYRKPLLDQNIMYRDDFMELAPKQDDLWFNLARQIANTSVFVSPDTNKYVYPIKTPDALSETNFSVTLSGWDTFLKAVFDRVIFGLKGYLGISICDNDIVIRRLDDFVKSLQC